MKQLQKHVVVLVAYILIVLLNSPKHYSFETDHCWNELTYKEEDGGCNEERCKFDCNYHNTGSPTDHCLDDGRTCCCNPQCTFYIYDDQGPGTKCVELECKGDCVKAGYDRDTSHCDEIDPTHCCCGRRWALGDQIEVNDIQSELDDNEFMEEIQKLDDEMTVAGAQESFEDDKMNVDDVQEFLAAAKLLHGDTDEEMNVDNTEEQP